MRDARPDDFAALRTDAVRAAFAGAFGSAPVDAVRPVLGGASASAFRVEVRGRWFLVRVEGPASPLRNPHQYVSMRIAAEAGIAPTIHYIDEVAGVAVMDFVAQRTLDGFPGGAGALAAALGALLRRVQATPRFPAFIAYPDLVARLWAHVCGTGLFAAGVLDAHSERLARIREEYVVNEARSVSSHNDIIPANILFDGVRLWAIDWESGYRNDPLVDVAIVLDTLAASPELAEILLRAWFGGVPDEEVRARLVPARALTRLYYAGVFLSASATAPRARPDAELSVPTVASFRQDVRAWRYVPGAPETKHILGKMFLAAVLADSTPPGFDAAVRNG